MEVLHRALSSRAMEATTKGDLDASRHLEHIAEGKLDSDVTGSSVEAISSFLRSAQVRTQHNSSLPVASTFN